nr:reverse transcriptase domain-containing protein [Tanacetum cinerariifolium]
ANNESTKYVQPLVVQVETQIPNSEPVVALIVKPVEAPVSAPKPNQKPSIPYPSRLHNQKLQGDILLLEEFLNDDPSSPPLPPQELKVVEHANEKSFIDEPPMVELKDFPPHLEYAFLEGDDKLPLIITKDLKDKEKTALIKEKIHFMVKEGIVLGHKISKNEIEVDMANVDVIPKLPYPTIVKGIRSFLGHAGFYRRFIEDFSKISRPITRLLEKDTLFFFSKECIKAFQTLKKKLTEAPILVAPDWDLPFELMCDASDFAIGSVLG